MLMLMFVLDGDVIEVFEDIINIGALVTMIFLV